MARLPPRATLTDSPLPSTTLFRSTSIAERGEADAALKLALSLPLSRLAASPYYAITMAIAYANQGDKAKASAYWMQVAEAGRAKGAETPRAILDDRTEEHTSELQSLMRISYAVFCLKTKTQTRT